jgi:hypothetical protein
LPGAAGSAVGSRPAVAVQNRVRDGSREVGPDRLCRGDVAEELGLIEAAHVHRPLDDLAAASECEASTTSARDGDATEIDVGRQAPVDLDLTRTRHLAALERGKIHVGEGNGALDLPGVRTGQKDQVAVRLEPLHRLDARIARRVG